MGKGLRESNTAAIDCRTSTNICSTQEPLSHDALLDSTRFAIWAWTSFLSAHVFRKLPFPFYPVYKFTQQTHFASLPRQTHKFCLFSPLCTHELWSSANKFSATSTPKLLISVEEWQMEESSPASFLAALPPEVWIDSMCPHSSLTWEPLLDLLQRVQNWKMAQTNLGKGGWFRKNCFIKICWNS